MFALLRENVIPSRHITLAVYILIKAEWRNKENEPPKDWPSEGRIEFINYSVRYRKELDCVLKSISFKINSCEKVNI